MHFLGLAAFPMDCYFEQRENIQMQTVAEMMLASLSFLRGVEADQYPLLTKTQFSMQGQVSGFKSQ